MTYIVGQKVNVVAFHGSGYSRKPAEVVKVTPSGMPDVRYTESGYVERFNATGKARCRRPENVSWLESAKTVRV